jgi:hypothetical protein
MHHMGNEQENRFEGIIGQKAGADRRYIIYGNGIRTMVGGLYLVNDVFPPLCPPVLCHR